MRWGLVTFACLAACSGEPGVDLKIQVPTDFDEVELYVANDGCDTCAAAGVGWPQTTTRVPGGVWLMTGAELVVQSDVIVDGAGAIHLQAGEGFNQARAIGIAAFKTNATGGRDVVAATVLHDTVIPLDAQETWTVTLHSTELARASTAPPASGEADERALAWDREAPPTTDAYAGCFAYQAWDGTAWNTEYFVPATDTDCDGQATADCDAYWAHNPTSIAQRCATLVPTPPAVCALGNRRCLDETPSTCMANDTLACLPSDVCNCTSDPATCFMNRFNGPMASSNVPVAHCAFQIDPASSVDRVGCTYSNNNNSGEIMTIPFAGTCQISAALPTGTPVVGVRQVGDPYGQANPGPFAVGTAMVRLHSTQSGSTCFVTVEWLPGSSAPTTTAPLTNGVLLQVAFTDRLVLVPLWISFTTNATVCPQLGTPCTLNGSWPESGNAGDSIFECVR